jgi:hypothetical protein
MNAEWICHRKFPIARRNGANFYNPEPAHHFGPIHADPFTIFWLARGTSFMLNARRTIPPAAMTTAASL